MVPESGKTSVRRGDVAAAVFNAIYAATGRRIRQTPLRPGDLGGSA
jgi:CO/xanthine dehydrogenase Mo-binding subunit